MKKSVYISGIVCANLMMFGSMFKVFHWPGSGIMLCSAVFLFCFMFLPFALMSSYACQEQKNNKWLYMVTFVVFSVSMMGALFKIMHWPGAGMFLVVGIPLPFVLFLPVYLYQTRKENKSINYLGIMFGLTFLAVFSVLLSLNVSKNIMDNAASNISGNDNFAFFNQSKVKEVSADNKVKLNSDELCAYIDNLKCELLTDAEEVVCVDSKLPADFDPLQIVAKDNTDVPARILLGDEPTKKLDELKAKINLYRELILTSGKINPELTVLTNSLFDISAKEVSNGDVSQMQTWEELEFKSYQLIFVLDVLSQIQSNVRLVEAEFLALK